jgi:hypothetical protein
LILDSVDRSTEVLRRFGGAEVASKPRGLGDRGYRRPGLAAVLDEDFGGQAGAAR